MTVAEKLEKRGRVKGQIKLVADQLRAKFQERAENWIPKLSEFGEDSLEKIGRRILFENNLEKIFENLEAKTT